MYKITLPIDLNGSRYGIEFFRGVGQTDDERLAEVLRDKGLTVEFIPAEAKPKEPPKPRKAPEQPEG